MALCQLTVIGLFRHLCSNFHTSQFIRAVEVQRKSGIPSFASDIIQLVYRLIKLLVFRLPVLGSGILGNRCLYRPKCIPATGELARVEASRCERRADRRGKRIVSRWIGALLSHAGGVRIERPSGEPLHSRPFADPDSAARKLTEIANTTTSRSRDSRVYIEKINWPFMHELRSTTAEYKAGLDLANREWLALTSQRRSSSPCEPDRIPDE